MTAPRTIYSPTDWPSLHTDPRHDTLLTWLRINGINPNDLPPNQNITIDGGLIRYVALVRDGNEPRCTSDGSLVLEGRTARCTVDPPHELAGD